MSKLEVTALTVPDLLSTLSRGEWLVPEFQRQFVWSIEQVSELITSIFSSRPIGMATLWEQPDETGLPLESISIPDNPGQDNLRARFFSNRERRPAKVYAILDGKQRCTAIAMAFGGLRAQNQSFRFAGRFYLNVAIDDEYQRVVFLKETDIRRGGLDVEAKCISEGLFPLSSYKQDEGFMAQWMRYLQVVRSPEYYPGRELPAPIELERRDAILKNAFQGIVDTKLAVYIVPQAYGLGDICEIFDKLNTTGTLVSTVDLIHSWLYRDTAQNSATPTIKLRDWLDEIGQRDGGVGWASSTVRPELTAQIATACYIALSNENKAQPRRIGRNSPTSVASVKSGDLLATPTTHWQHLVENQDSFVDFLKDFQTVVAGGPFPQSVCPYPVTAAIYVALRWHARFETTAGWTRAELDALFRAFFWRNALLLRYDQGFLTKLGTDLKKIREILELRAVASSINDWAGRATLELSEYLTKSSTASLPGEVELCNALTDTRPAGAASRAYLLPMFAMAEKDVVDPEISLRFPSNVPVEMHHIYPRGWCDRSRSGALAEVLDPDRAGRDWVNSISNLMPLSRTSNNIWNAKLPGQLFRERNVEYSRIQDRLAAAFIDEECFRLLVAGADGIPQFWARRASLIARDLMKRTELLL